MKKILVLLCYFMSTFAFATDDFGGGDEDEFDFDRFSNEGIYKQIEEDMAIECLDDGLCKIISTDDSYGGWEVSFNIGEGTNFSGNGGTNIYTGDYDSNGEPTLSWGVSVSYGRGSCERTVYIPRAQYLVINRYLRSLVDENGDIRDRFEVSQDTMLMFVTTVQSHAGSCNGK